MIKQYLLQLFFFFFNDTATTEIYTLSLHDALPILVKASLHGLRIAEVPTVLRKDGRSRPPHLKPWRDGWRHLRFMLLFSPRWLFLVPGLALSFLGLAVAAPLSFADFRVGPVLFNVGTLAVGCMTLVIGFQIVAFAFFTKVFAIAEGLLPDDPKLSRLFRVFTLEKGIVAGLLVLLTGVVLLIRALWIWKQAGYGMLPSVEENLRR